MTRRDDDIALTDEEIALAERGAALVAAAIAHPETRAPQELREALERGRLAAGAPRRRMGGPARRVVAPAIAVACVLAAALVVALGGTQEGAGAPSLEQVAAVTRLPALRGAPAAAGGGRLSLSVEGLAFPDWRGRFGWATAGRRTDRIGDRVVTTVFYRYSDHRRLGYAIVAGSPLRPAAGRDVMSGGARYRVITRGGRTTVTWTQARHTCVIDAPATVAPAELVRLAAWANV